MSSLTRNPRAMALRLQDQLMHLHSLCEYIIESTPDKQWHYHVDIFEVRKMISSMCHLFNKQRLHDTLNSKQHNIAQRFERLQRLLKECNVIRKTNDSADVLPFWTVLKQELDLSNSSSMQFLKLSMTNTSVDGLTLFFEDKDKGQQLIDTCLELEDILIDITCHKSKLPAFRRWLTNDTLGSIDQVSNILRLAVAEFQ